MPAPASHDRWERLPDGSHRRRPPAYGPAQRTATPAAAAEPEVEDLGLESLGAAHPPAMVEAATPAAAELADELGVDLAAVEGTGKEGRITKADVERAAE